MPSLSNKRHFLILITAVFALQMVGCGESHYKGDAEREIWRFAIEESEGSVQHEYALEFKQLIESRSAGAVEVIIYPYGTLGTSTQTIEQLNMGAIEFAMASPGTLGKFIPELQVFLLHFILPQDERQTQGFLSNPELIAFFDELYAPKGLRLLSIFSEGEMVWTMKQEVRSPDDFRGIKMRVMTSPLLLAAYNAYGASATPMPYSEVYSGLQLNMIDGQVNPIFAIERQKFHEVTSWMIFPGHASFITTCAANHEFFDHLPSEKQHLVSTVIEKLDEFIFDVQVRFQTERLKAILRDKKRQRSTLTICGDLSGFIASLTPEERRELIDENPYLQRAPQLTSQEREAFRRASECVQDKFLYLGGPRSQEVLHRVNSVTSKMLIR
ncbi:MAG: TRAP transporter substrate-binding protein DctP [Pirellulales bacterium]